LAIRVGWDRRFHTVAIMVRPSRAATTDEAAAARARLEAMRLRPSTRGWVPDPTVPDMTVPDRMVPDVAEPGIADVPVSSRPPPPPPAIGELMRAWAIDRSPLWTHTVLERVRVRGLLLGLGAVVAAIVAGVLVFQHGSSTAGSSSYDFAGTRPATAPGPSVSAAPSTATDVTSIVVDVGGRVRKPGLVTLPAGARVADAIAAAGGPLHHKEIATLDLAARVSDGQLLLVGVPDSETAGGSDAGGSSTGPAAPVGLNSATIDELETLPGVGPVTAQKIIDWRTAHNGFTNVIQLQQVSGIGPARYAELSPLVTP
jgi:competence protein ComEA